MKLKICILGHLENCADWMKAEPVKLPRYAPKWLRKYNFYTNIHLESQKGFRLTHSSTGMAFPGVHRTRAVAIREGITKASQVGPKKFAACVKKAKKMISNP